MNIRNSRMKKIEIDLKCKCLNTFGIIALFLYEKAEPLGSQSTLDEMRRRNNDKVESLVVILLRRGLHSGRNAPSHPLGPNNGLRRKKAFHRSQTKWKKIQSIDALGRRNA